jgi:hypothetical protein
MGCHSQPQRQAGKQNNTENEPLSKVEHGPASQAGTKKC